MNQKTRNITHAALIGAMYFALTHLQNLLVPNSATWAIQFRASEALCVLALFTPAAIPGLTIGCLLFNLSFEQKKSCIVGCGKSFGAGNPLAPPPPVRLVCYPGSTELSSLMHGPSPSCTGKAWSAASAWDRTLPFLSAANCVPWAGVSARILWGYASAALRIGSKPPRGYFFTATAT